MLFYEGGISYNEDIMHSSQKFIVVSFQLPSPSRKKDIEISFESIAQFLLRICDQ